VPFNFVIDGGALKEFDIPAKLYEMLSFEEQSRILI